ncbi:MarR family winged helix-turn-helix transcriptional regulator [Siccirubricoccus sp. G192]|uniref:MarR family winged helix-turn-helix transcriptional regulator n=1 Tax=Siccirubricoccus sp. G192 TaxID=2849651 RepID=UPI001C2CA8D3|nr:MarR family winged helix-turn-helix transcriptional regulator [Siccirubricoccus sp. G192]MBV1796548.1 MarR family winged helix-turn-helix transcriptional regulator [Siccirubricoccus sp. G192]
MPDEVSPTLRGIPPAYRAPTHLARRFFQVCQAIGHEAMRPFGLEMRHTGVFVVLSREPGIDQRSLAAALGRDQTSTAQMVDDLQALGLVERRPSPANRRTNALFLTATGAALLRDRLTSAIAGVQARVLDALSPEEAATFLALLVRIVEANEAHARPGAARRPPRRRPRGTALPEPEGDAPWPPSPPVPGGPPLG